ncbi:MAG: hypothetical protein N2234_02380 [Planctomycetota bacterium]|nr:hypothetical protein [Planctomycetota bacterium]
MAIHSKCLFCGYGLSVADEMRGKKVKCPNCGEKTPIMAEEEKAELKQKYEAEMAEERAKIAKARREALMGEQVTPSHYNHLRILANILLFFGYLTLIVAVILGLLFFLTDGKAFVGESAPYILLLLFFIGGFISFIIYKAVAEVVRLFADIGDAHNDTIEVLCELRDIMRSLSQRSTKTAQPKPPVTRP